MPPPPHPLVKSARGAPPFSHPARLALSPFSQAGADAATMGEGGRPTGRILQQLAGGRLMIAGGPATAREAFAPAAGLGPADRRARRRGPPRGAAPRLHASWQRRTWAHPCASRWRRSPRCGSPRTRRRRAGGASTWPCGTSRRATRCPTWPRCWRRRRPRRVPPRPNSRRRRTGGRRGSSARCSRLNGSPRATWSRSADFGLSAFAGSSGGGDGEGGGGGGQTHRSTRTLGTVAYMPPELLARGRLSSAADTYAFGMLMGRRTAVGLSIFSISRLGRRVLFFSRSHTHTQHTHIKHSSSPFSPPPHTQHNITSPPLARSTRPWRSRASGRPPPWARQGPTAC